MIVPYIPGVSLGKSNEQIIAEADGVILKTDTLLCIIDENHNPVNNWAEVYEERGIYITEEERRELVKQPFIPGKDDEWLEECIKIRKELAADTAGTASLAGLMGMGSEEYEVESLRDGKPRLYDVKKRNELYEKIKAILAGINLCLCATILGLRDKKVTENLDGKIPIDMTDIPPDALFWLPHHVDPTNIPKASGLTDGNGVEAYIAKLIINNNTGKGKLLYFTTPDTITQYDEFPSDFGITLKKMNEYYEKMKDRTVYHNITLDKATMLNVEAKHPGTFPGLNESVKGVLNETGVAFELSIPDLDTVAYMKYFDKYGDQLYRDKMLTQKYAELIERLAMEEVKNLTRNVHPHNIDTSEHEYPKNPTGLLDEKIKQYFRRE